MLYINYISVIIIHLNPIQFSIVCIWSTFPHRNRLWLRPRRRKQILQQLRRALSNGTCFGCLLCLWWWGLYDVGMVCDSTWWYSLFWFIGYMVSPQYVNEHDTLRPVAHSAKVIHVTLCTLFSCDDKFDLCLVTYTDDTCTSLVHVNVWLFVDNRA